MSDTGQILKQIKDTVADVDPTAKVILFGSYARGDNHAGSDIDLLILLNKEKISYSDETSISFPLFMLEAKLGVPISPIIYSRYFWEHKHKVTPFYENVNMEGVAL